MFLWRVSNYASLDGAGGLYASARWHTKGWPVIYCAQTPSTALLETLVHMEIDAEDRPEYFKVLKISVPETVSAERLDVTTAPANWPSDLSISRMIGDQWLAERRTLLLEVPSVLVPETWNVLVNPLHPEAASMAIEMVYEHPFDARFFR